MSHTPGPWTLKLNSGINGARIVGAGGELVANVTRFADKSTGQKRADAHLIAAAPDLLAAMKWFLSEDFEHCGAGDCGYCKALEMAKAAIAKATGGSK